MMSVIRRTKGIFFLVLIAVGATAHANNGVSDQVVSHLNAERRRAKVPAITLNPTLSQLAQELASTAMRGDSLGDPCDFIRQKGYRWKSCAFAMRPSPSSDPKVILRSLRSGADLNSPLVEEVGLFIQKVGKAWAVAIFMAAPLPLAELNRGQFLSLLNQFRATSGLQPVAFEKRLERCADRWAQKHAKWQLDAVHKARGSNLEKRIASVRYPVASAFENVGRFLASDSQLIFEGWRGSEGHRLNMLEKEVSEIGLACAHAPLRNHRDLGEYVCVLVLGRPR